MNENTQKLAERIALLLQDSDKQQNDFSALRISLDKINQRLDKIESQIAFQNSNLQFQAPNPGSFHTSQEKFAIAEAVAGDISVDTRAEKICAFEPNGKPCDHCSMCNSRGF